MKEVSKFFPSLEEAILHVEGLGYVLESENENNITKIYRIHEISYFIFMLNKEKASVVYFPPLTPLKSVYPGYKNYSLSIKNESLYDFTEGFSLFIKAVYGYTNGIIYYVLKEKTSRVYELLIESFFEEIIWEWMIRTKKIWSNEDRDEMRVLLDKLEEG